MKSVTCRCSRNASVPLELRKIYEVLEDRDAEPHDLVRVIDESGEDYLYPRDWCLAIELPENVEEAIAHIASC
jgi:hypothetical protein